jgi:hypothetical protein
MSGYISKLQACRKNATYLKLEKLRFLFLEGSTGASTAPTGASALPAGTSTDDPVTGGSVPAWPPRGLISWPPRQPVGMGVPRVPTY